MSHYHIGLLGESEAQEYLKSHGLTFVEKNYKIKAGEIDLIMEDGEHLVFVEVRLRGNADHGSSIETVTPTKQQRIIRTAKHYLQATQQYDKVPCRFDVVGIDAHQKITWIKDAFQVKY